MKNREKKRRRGREDSLGVRLIYFLLLGLVLGGCVYLILRFSIVSVINHHYATDGKRREREDAYIEKLQTYITKNNLSSADIAELSEFAKHSRYVYLIIYRDNELLYSSGDSQNKGDLIGGGGITVDLPKREELLKYAKENSLYALDSSDGLLFASVREFSEYLYYDLANILGLVACALVITLVMLLYYRRVAARISRLASDVKRVADGDMKHSIRTDTERDEISELSENVENMRGAVLQTLSKEREALDRNNELITSLSHDIRTPLTVLLGYLDILKTHNTDELTGEYLRASEKTALHMKELTDDMFRYFLVFGTRDPDLSIRDYDAATLLEQMISEHVLLLREGGFTVKVTEMEQLAREGLSVAVDAPFLKRIFDNIFSNLEKYADRHHPIRIDISHIGKCVQVRFTNRIRRGAPPTESTQIGLKTCRRIADAMKVDFQTVNDATVYTTVLDLPLGNDVIQEEDSLAILSTLG